MIDLPSGTVTFLFTDIEGSAALWERERQATARAVERHLDLLREAITSQGGMVFKIVGDAVQAAFATAPAAVEAAVDAERALLSEKWTTADPLHVRIALHAGEAEPRAGDYLAAPLNRLSRLLATGHGGQILLTQTVQQLTRGALPQDVTLRDLGEHRLRDLLEPERIWQVVGPGLALDFPPLKTLESRPNNLPRQPTPFLGREKLVADLMALLPREDIQLVTLTGPGGTGKTRLALQAAAEALDVFPDGVYFVDLAPLTDPALVTVTIAGVLGVRSEGSGAASDALAGFLREKRLLLLLDNFEHLLAAAPMVGDLLRRCPHLTALATSRAPLRLRAEREIPVPPLTLPDPARREPLERLTQYEAVRLFTDRAIAAKPDFTLDNENAPAVAEICACLDGLPLAIELAAARVRMLPPQALRRRLERRLPLLTGGARDAPQRQRTLRDAIAWSHDLLDEEDQTLFRRLAVFAGGATLEATEAIVNQEGTHDVFAGIDSLVDKSLLRQEEGADGEPRFRMLETVREFALERLAASGEGTACRARHARFFLDLAERVGPRVGEPASPAALDVIDRELDNLRAALGWAQETDDDDALLRLAAALPWFWYDRGYFSEGQRWLEQALATPADAAGARPRAWALMGSGVLASVSGKTERAAAVLTESLRWWKSTGDSAGYAFASSLLGGVYVSQGRYDEAAPLFAANRDYFREADHASMLAHADFHLGLIAWMRGDAVGARGLLRESAEGYDRAGARTNAINPLRYLGLAACAAGEPEEAVRWFREEWARLRQLRSLAALGVGLADVAALAAARQAWRPAARLFAKAEALLQAEAAAFSLPARDHYQRGRDRAWEALGAAAAEAAAAGQALTLEQAMLEAEAVLQLDGEAGAGATPAPQRER